MGFPDIRTIFLTNVCTFSICALVMVLLWRQSRDRYQGLAYLVIDYLLQVAATALIALRGVIPNIMSIGLAQILVFTGSLLGYMGLERFVGKIGSQLHNYIVLVGYGALMICVSVFSPASGWRHYAFLLATLFIWSQCLWLLWYRVAPGMRPLTFGTGIVFLAFCLVNVFRIGQHLLSPLPLGDYMRSGPVEAMFMIVYQMLLVLLTYALVLMVNKRLFGDLKVSEQKFTSAFRSSPNALVLSRLRDGRIMEVNDGFVQLSGYQAGEAVGKTSLELNIWADVEERAAMAAELTQEGRIRSRELQFQNKAGGGVTGLLAAEVIEVEGESCLLSSINDISERKRMEEEIRELSLRDSLTELYNRRGFFTVAAQMMKTATRTGEKLFLTFGDCDGLKGVNDLLGHEEGDRVLTAAAEVLSRTFRAADVVARMGGDEFAVLSEATPGTDPAVLSRRLQTNIEAYNREHAGPWRLGMSWGVTVFDPAHPVSLDELVAAADNLMYREKKAKAAAGA